MNAIQTKKDGGSAVALEFLTGQPPVAPGQMKTFIALMVSRHNGRDFVVPLYYLNAYPLEREDCDCKEEHDEGCPSTGWFYDQSNFEYDNCYFAVEGEVIAWAALPSPQSARAALASQTGSRA